MKKLTLLSAAFAIMPSMSQSAPVDLTVTGHVTGSCIVGTSNDYEVVDLGRLNADSGTAIEEVKIDVTFNNQVKVTYRSENAKDLNAATGGLLTLSGDQRKTIEYTIDEDSVDIPLTNGEGESTGNISNNEHVFHILADKSNDYASGTYEDTLRVQIRQQG